MNKGFFQREEYGSLDLFRIIAAILVIAIHTSPLTSVNPDLDFFLTRILARVAVPFFFMTTGQFLLTGRLDKTRAYDYRIVVWIRKMLLLYFAATLLYLPVSIYAGQLSKITPAGMLKRIFFDGTFYHLWYFPACIIGVLLLVGLSRLCTERLLLVIATLLYIYGLLGDSYYGFAIKVPVLSNIVNRGFTVWSYTRNGLFFAPLFLLIGSKMDCIKEHVSGKKSFIGFLLFFLMMTAEGFSLHAADVQKHDSMYFFLPAAMVFLYCLILSIRSCTRKRVRSMSVGIYILHPFAILIVRRIAVFLSAPVLTDNSLIHFGMVTIITMLLVAVLQWISNRWRTIRKAQKCRSQQGRAWIEISEETLQNNIKVFRSMVPGDCSLMPAVKANAYGHGDVPVAKICQHAGINYFCVACAREGIKLRKAGISGEILILGYTHPEDFRTLRRYRLIQAVVDESYYHVLQEQGKYLHVHVAVDTGMHRLGIDADKTDIIAAICKDHKLIVDGIFTHLATADGIDDSSVQKTKDQLQIFEKLQLKLRQEHLTGIRFHALASYGIFNYSENCGDCVRPGIALYGVPENPADEVESRNLYPVLMLKARISSVREVDAGDSVGYGTECVADRRRTVAWLAVGYADGVPRSLGDNGGEVLIHGKRAKIIGRICMDQMMADVTDIPNACQGDTAVLIGRSGDDEITACDWAAWTGTITNEILSRLGERLDRIMV